MSYPMDSPTQQQLTAPPPGQKHLSSVASLGKKQEEILVIEVVTETLDLSDALEPTPASVMMKAMHRQWAIQFTILCMASFLVGWADGTIGPIIPQLQEFYHVGYTHMSLILILSTAGYISAACAYIYLTDRFGFGVIVVGASIFMTVSSVIQVFAPPFPVFVLSCVVARFGAMFLDRGSSAFIARLAGDTSVKMSIKYAVQGVGSTCAPLVVTQLICLPRWSFIFLFALGFSVITAISQAFAFKFKSQEDCLKVISQPPHKSEHATKGIEKYKQVLHLPAVHTMALFQFISAGFEMTLTSWIITFVIKERHGGPNSGYVSSGFWGGYTLGRLLLIPLTKKLGTWRAMFLYILLSLSLELIIWLVPSFTVTAIATAFLGIFFGPVSVIVMSHTGRVLPPELVGDAISWMALCSSVGVVIFLFIIAVVASCMSIDSLPPMIIAMLGLTLVIWAFVPKDRARLI
ncbi:hypothetical protein V8D89_008727 [Ganoderma adspersum]